MRIPIISPSFLSADFANLERECKMINNSDADWFHLDIMDGRFVPNISFGLPVISAIKKHATKPLDVHIMIVEPEKYISAFKKAGADILTVHAEACPHLHRVIQQIKDEGMKAGVALNPHTPISVLENIIEDVDMVLIMSVNPGFGGQKFIKQTYAKVAELKQLILNTESKTLIQVDGGVDNTNMNKLFVAGVDAFVAGSYIFKSENVSETIKKMKDLDLYLK